jgi:hypothetical protein
MIGSHLRKVRNKGGLPLETNKSFFLHEPFCGIIAYLGLDLAPPSEAGHGICCMEASKYRA